jgi:hypothetical protein
MGTVHQLEEVNEKVIPLFSEAADHIIKMNNGDMRQALCQTLALLSGHHKEEMRTRSLLNGQEDCDLPTHNGVRFPLRLHGVEHFT